jgi:hypothetical protein
VVFWIWCVSSEMFSFNAVYIKFKLIEMVTFQKKKYSSVKHIFGKNISAF